MKRFFSRLLPLLLASAIAACVAGCGETAAGPKQADSQPAATPAPGEPGELPDTPATSEPTEPPDTRLDGAEAAALAYLENRLYEGSGCVYVYSDFGAMNNNFTQKALIGNGGTVRDMDENAEGAYKGSSAIRCETSLQGGQWGGWLFLNGRLPRGETVPRLDFGDVPDAKLDLAGASCLAFMARGENGGEQVEFFTAGLGYDGETYERLAPWPDSCYKCSTGFVELTDEWEQYSIDLRGADLSGIGCGFGLVASGDRYEGGMAFYLDEIRFEGDIAAAKDAPRFMQSYEIDVREDPDGIYIQNAAFSYDNALCAMAFLAAGKPEQAKAILDSFVYAVANDRYEGGRYANDRYANDRYEGSHDANDRYANGRYEGSHDANDRYEGSHDANGRYEGARVRNAYAYGDITPFPGWESGTRLPGWYDNDAKAYYEDQYQVGTNVGNSSYVALALLQYYNAYGGEEYLGLAMAIMDWVMARADGSPGFTAGYDGWPETGNITDYSYKSIEHNIDAYAAFKQLYAVTKEPEYKAACDSALAFIETMYDPAEQVFYTGTEPDGVTVSRENIVLDAQVWCALALGDDFSPYLPALERAIAMQTAEGGFPFHEANSNGGYWLEGTAFTALALRGFGHDGPADAAFEAIMSSQLETGGLPAATAKGLSTGFSLFTGDPWLYGDSPHIAPVAWFVMAAEGFNPYGFR